LDTPYSPGPFHLDRSMMSGWAIRDAKGNLVGGVSPSHIRIDAATDRQIEANAALLVSADLAYELMAEVYELYYRVREPELLQSRLAEWITRAAPVVGTVGYGHVPFNREATYVRRLREAKA
jgi:hypothetical protein